VSFAGLGNPQGFSGFLPPGAADATGPFVYDPGVPEKFGYRIKFVQGDAESTYALADTRLSTRDFTNVWQLHMYLPTGR
jgi:hypothetical protein